MTAVNPSNPAMVDRHAGRIVLVTGGVGGIGAAIVRRYVDEGAAIAIMDRDGTAGEAAVATLTATGIRAHFAVGDVGNFDDCARAVAAFERHLGPIDTLVCNAGISPKHDGRPVRIDAMDPAEWRSVVGVNLDAAFYLARLVSPGMIDRQFGRIVLMSSVAGRAYLDIVGAHYSATKGALIALTRHLAGELGAFGITANALAPGRIDTPMLRSVSGDTNDAVIRPTPMGRLGTPQEVAAVCTFLSSADASFVTGQVIDVAGGWLMT